MTPLAGRAQQDDLLKIWTNVKATVGKAYEKLAGWHRQCAADGHSARCGVPAIEALSRRCPAAAHWLSAERPLQGYHVLCIGPAADSEAGSSAAFDVSSFSITCAFCSLAVCVATIGNDGPGRCVQGRGCPPGLQRRPGCRRASVGRARRRRPCAAAC